jgi:hypothetical protein
MVAGCRSYACDYAMGHAGQLRNRLGNFTLSLRDGG